MGLLRGGRGLADVAALAGPASLPGLNYVLCADQDSLVPLLRNVGGPPSRTPFLAYVCANVTLSRAAGLSAPLAINRPLLLVGSSSVLTSIDFGMQASSLAALGGASHVTLRSLVLENLGPGDAAAAPLAGQYNLMMGYNMWPLLFNRCGE